MKAAFIQTTGVPEVIEFGDLAIADPDDHQVLVRMGAVSVNPIDTYLRSGAVKATLPLPYVIGSDIAGTVESVGKSVKRFAVGDRVWGSNQGLGGRQGTFAEFCTIDEEWLYPSPENVNDETLAAIALTGITAHLGLHLHGQLQAGEVVFVNGGTGGVGSAVVQIAKAAGAAVVATVGSLQKQQLAIKLGADYVINYREENVKEALPNILKQTGPVNLWFESLRNPDPGFTIPLMAKRGRYVLMAGREARPEFPVGPFYVNDLRAIGFAMFNASQSEQRTAADALKLLMADEKLAPIIGARFKLAEAAAAHRLQEENTLHSAGTLTGKIVLAS